MRVVSEFGLVILRVLAGMGDSLIPGYLEL